MTASPKKEEEEEEINVKDVDSRSDEDDATATAADATRKHSAKRRTKTGCLTCRKRRIKCGEEKPICRNCVKSKRDCAGYSQPLVYKQQSRGHDDPSYHTGDSFAFEGQRASSFSLQWQPDQQHLSSYPGMPQPDPPRYDQGQFGASYDAISAATPIMSRHSMNTFKNESVWQGPPLLPQAPTVALDPALIAPNVPGRHLVRNYSHGPMRVDPQVGSLYGAAIPGFVPAAPFAYHTPPLVGDNQSLDSNWPLPQQYQHQLSSYSAYAASDANFAEEHVGRQFRAQAGLQYQPYVPATAVGLVARAQTLQAPEEEYEDPEDPFDVEMEDKDLSYENAATNLTEILGRAAQPSYSATRLYVPRRTEVKTIATYGPPIAISPLQDERNEQTFCHFVEITSNTMSIFERHHFSPIAAPARTLWNFTIPALALSHAALAHAILALAALHLAKLNNTTENTAIKHFTYAVRRVGRLLGLPHRRHEIATLATVLVLGYYEVVAGDHSRWNLHLSGAARLVLEHDYAGLTRTVRRMRKDAKGRLNEWTAQFTLTEENYARVAGIPSNLLSDTEWEVDQGFVSRLIGVQVNYDRQYQPNFSLHTTKSSLSDRDTEDFKTKLSLRWWYCKQDIFQSMVSGDRPLMALDNWIYCPPRGEFGRADTAYATFDYLLLIMARLVDFGGKDRGRKLRAVEAKGGQWIPPKWLFGSRGPPAGPPAGKRQTAHPGPFQQPPHPAATITASVGAQVPTRAAEARPSPTPNEGRPRQSRPSSGFPGAAGPPPPMSVPPMLGMMPPVIGPVQIDSAFRTMDSNIHDPAYATQYVQSTTVLPKGLEDDFERAMMEYNAITKAFDVFAESLGVDFRPINNDGHAVPSPFGPALVYKNAAVACTWACYYMARISLQRQHPEMPPAAMVAAGVSAHLTRENAQMVGKICAGLYATQQYGQYGALDPSFAGALMESTIFLLFAGIQYQDAAQRGWVVSKLKDVERRCGWKTSGAIASACETAWEKMAQAGRGPPYQRVRDINSKDARVSGAGRHSGLPLPRDGSASAVSQQHESEFVEHDRSLIDRSSSTRVHWALGLLAVEDDIMRMTLND